MAKPRAPRRRRRLRARPLLVAAGAMLALAGSGCDDEPWCLTHGMCSPADMTFMPHDLGIVPHPDMAIPADLTPRGD